MAIKLNKSGYDYAVSIIEKGLEVEHKTDWKAVKPSKDEEARYLNTHTLDEYGLWFLGIDTDFPENDNAKFVYPYGDFSVLHKSALLAAEEQAQAKHNQEIKKAAEELVKLVDEKTKS